MLIFLSRIKATILFVGGFDSVVIDSVRHQTPQTVAWVRKCPSESHYQESRRMNVIEQPWVSVCMCVMGPWRHPEVRGHATQGLEMPSHITSLATGALCVWKCVECPSAAYIWPSVCKWCVFAGTCVSIGHMSLICLCLLCDGWSVSYCNCHGHVEGRTRETRGKVNKWDLMEEHRIHNYTNVHRRVDGPRLRENSGLMNT